MAFRLSFLTSIEFSLSSSYRDLDCFCAVDIHLRPHSSSLLLYLSFSSGQTLYVLWKLALFSESHCLLKNLTFLLLLLQNPLLLYRLRFCQNFCCFENFLALFAPFSGLLRYIHYHRRFPLVLLSGIDSAVSINDTKITCPLIV